MSRAQKGQKQILRITSYFHKDNSLQLQDTVVALVNLTKVKDSPEQQWESQLLKQETTN